MAKLIDLVKGAYADATVGIVDEVVKEVPEVAFFDARLVKGTQFKTLARISLPTAGFRTVGNGIDASRSGYGLKTFDLGILSGLVQIDKAEVLGDSLRSKEEVLSDEAIDLIVAGMKELASKIWYGGKAGAESFDGVAALCEDALVVDAGDSTANKCSSVYAVGNDAKKACGLVFSENSGFFLNGELDFKEGKMLGVNNKEVPCFWTDLTGWAGFSAVNSKKMARLANLGTASHTLTDALLAKLVNAYRKATGSRPDALFASYDQVAALQASRTATMVAPRERGSISAPWPTDHDGIPLIATNAIVDTEAVWSASGDGSSSGSGSGS